MNSMRRLCAMAGVLMFVAAAPLAADVLVLRDGRRINGVLVRIQNDTIEFEERGGLLGRRLVRFDRADVRRIEFDEEPVSGRPSTDAARDRSGMRERTIGVEARQPWTDTGIDVRAGQEVLFAATGEVRWGPGRRDGAAGERNSPFNAGRPMPDRNAAALIGRIGERGDPFFIGEESGPIRMRATGRLFLGINDDYLEDNSGSLRVRVSY